MPDIHGALTPVTDIFNFHSAQGRSVTTVVTICSDLIDAAEGNSGKGIAYQQGVAGPRVNTPSLLFYLWPL